MDFKKLGELCSFSRGASVPRARMYKQGDYLYIHYGDLYKGFELRIDVDAPQKRIPYITSDECIKDNQWLYDQDIVYVLTSETVDDLGHSFLFNNPRNTPVVAGTETTIVRVERRDLLNPAYLNYLMHSPRFKLLLRQYVKGMKVFRVHPDDISRIEIYLPNLDDQNKIVSLLDLIYKQQMNAKRTNDYLAAMCDAIFAYRFGNIEDNAVLSDIATITMGQSPSGKSYNEDGKGTVFYQGRSEFGWRFPTQRLFTTEPKRMAAKGDVLMSVRAPVGDLNVAYESCCIGRGLAAIHSQYPLYCLYLMRSLNGKLDAYNGEGTVFGSITGKSLNTLEIGLPDTDAIEAFEAFVRPIDQNIRTNVMEERALAAVRDVLLPKLMSGEIDVSRVELSMPLNNHLY